MSLGIARSVADVAWHCLPRVQASQPRFRQLRLPHFHLTTFMTRIRLWHWYFEVYAVSDLAYRLDEAACS